MNFAIIGCGVIAETHANALKRLAEEDCVLYACCDIVPEKADACAARHNVPKVYYTDEAVLADPDVDVVCVCVPSGSHGDVTIAAARAGKHIVCEKPLEITPERAIQAAGAARRYGVKMQSIHQRRMMPAAIAAREAIRKGQLGRVCLAEAQRKDYREQAYYDSAGWRGTWELDGGGALMNQGVHGVDLILWILGGQVDTLYGRAETLARKIPVEDTAAAVLRMKDGALCVIEGATTAYPGFSTAFSIYGERGTISFDDSGVKEWNFIDPETAPPRPEDGTAMGGAGSNIDITIDGHVALLRDLAQAVREDREPILPPEDALAAIKVICGIYESSRTGRPVRI